MIRSMTGFGRAETNEDGKKITVEMKSVNHRYCEISTRMPKKLNFYDSAVRQLVKKYVVRGKVDVYVSLQDDSDSGSNVKYNEAIAKEYLGYLKQMSDELGVANDVTVTSLARMPEVLVLEESESDQEKTWEQLEKTVILACENLSEMRAVEGAHLKEDIIGKLDGMVGYIDQIEKRTPEMMAAYRKKLKEKLDEVISDTNISEQLIAGELIIYSDKICVDEETVRLRTHITNMKKTLDAADNIGRKLDFLAQEMNREANTTLSKANDIEVSELAINLKTEIEKIREQIQNIE
ncbi:MAG: YicC family protein [Lachnospiraceae bacterium]|nr:YicC family protein [Lachnospiraceae bacterium]MBR6274207.1 YicC family protein [Lachnospiraceae bacterium]